MFSKVIVLGGGVSGAICAYYLDSSLLISEMMGGQIEAKFPMGPRYLHNKPAIRMILNELNLPTDVKKVEVGYYINGSYYNTISDDLRMEYYLKSRGLFKTNDCPRSVLSEGMNSFEVFTIDMKEFYEVLMSKINHDDRIIRQKIVKIDCFEKVLFSEKNYYKYDKLINTIPRDIFLNLTGIICEKKVFNPITYLFTSSDFDLMGYDYVYFPDMFDTVFHRVTKVKGGLVFDFAGDIMHSEALYEAEKFFNQKFEISDITKNIRAQIINKTYALEQDIFTEIIHIGRFAELDHSIKVENVIERARQIK